MPGTNLFGKYKNGTAWNLLKILEKSWNFVSAKKREPWIGLDKNIRAQLRFSSHLVNANANFFFDDWWIVNKTQHFQLLSGTAFAIVFAWWERTLKERSVFYYWWFSEIQLIAYAVNYLSWQWLETHGRMRLIWLMNRANRRTHNLCVWWWCCMAFTGKTFVLEKSN